MSDDLVKQLRAKNAYCAPNFSTPIADPVKLKAADRIEELEAKLRQSELREASMKLANEETRKFLREKSTMESRIEELEAAVKLNQDLDAISLDYVAALEAKLKTSEEIGRAFEEDAGQLRAKLAKAVEALTSIKARATMHRGDDDKEKERQLMHIHARARKALAELTGDKDE